MRSQNRPPQQNLIMLTSCLPRPSYLRSKNSADDDWPRRDDLVPADLETASVARAAITGLRVACTDIYTLCLPVTAGS